MENYRFEIQNVATVDEANDIAKEVKEATGESAIVSIDTATNTWKVWIGGVFATLEEGRRIQGVAGRKRF